MLNKFPRCVSCCVYFQHLCIEFFPCCYWQLSRDSIFCLQIEWKLSKGNFRNVKRFPPFSVLNLLTSSIWNMYQTHQRVTVYYPLRKSQINKILPQLNRDLTENIFLFIQRKKEGNFSKTIFSLKWSLREFIAKWMRSALEWAIIRLGELLIFIFTWRMIKNHDKDEIYVH